MNGINITVLPQSHPTYSQIRFQQEIERVRDIEVAKNRYFGLDRDDWLATIYGCTEESRNLKKKIRKLNQVIAKKTPESASGAISSLKAAQLQLKQLKTYTRTLGLAMAFVLDDSQAAKDYWVKQKSTITLHMFDQAGYIAWSLTKPNNHRQHIMLNRTEWGRNHEVMPNQLIGMSIAEWLK